MEKEADNTYSRRSDVSLKPSNSLLLISKLKSEGVLESAEISSTVADKRLLAVSRDSCKTTGL